ncbi:uncharacterized protein EAF02_002631 [Botrytis sinoallii]|uniref:uncharacterized protein n=1 Tax=Botrytis sinoallii TaxID=1463999 RepID=UPI0018FFC2D9|nr:uncharacterized protein EAF02_002631 [Botrytis sinoallii]KAF7888090.1 hypothetical protein EAF02_002631 [Botrytis sinoallii]
MTTNKLQVFKFGDGVWDPSHRFVTSWLLSPWALFAVRASISLYAFFVLLFSIFWEIARLPNGGATARFSFSYFTISATGAYPSTSSSPPSTPSATHAAASHYSRAFRAPSKPCTLSTTAASSATPSSSPSFSGASSSGSRSPSAGSPPPSTPGPTSPNTASTPCSPSSKSASRAPRRRRGFISSGSLSFWPATWVSRMSRWPRNINTCIRS